jgi:V/A-type H+-transporting ATPase subunit A
MILGTVPETQALEHRVMVPPNMRGTLTWVAPEMKYTIDEPIARIKTEKGEQELTMLQRWPVRRARPYKTRLGQSGGPLVTGQRVLDTFFPLAKGGAAAIPGGFGSGKTVTQQSIAKWSDAQVVVYIGCGERGNEMTEVLQEFPQLVDPRSGHPLMERTVLIANTSNMPVAAREASIYTGITIAEYYRDMGYHVALMADSTSRWAEALREVSGRLEEMPAEEGFPAYLANRLAEFYERAGYVETFNGKSGSVSIIGAVSPPGGDFSEPVTQHTKRFIRCFWALDKSLASARHFPSINWLDSYSEYLEDVAGWWQEQVGMDWLSMRNEAMALLSEENRLTQIVKLVGPDALPDEQRLILETSRLLREGFLQQNALDDVDAYSTVQKQIRMLDLILQFHHRALPSIKRGATIAAIHQLPVVDTLVRMKAQVTNDELAKLDDISKAIDEQMTKLEMEFK